MASSIDATKPIAGNPTTLSVRDNFAAAKSEIEALQSGKADVASPTFTGTATIPAASITSLTFNGVAITATGTEINTALDGITATAAELNALSALSGVTATAAELNKLDGATVTTAEINILDGVTATAAELNRVDVTAGTMTASKALVTDASNNLNCNNGNFTNVDINSGAIDGTPIGASSASTGAFTTLSASGTTNVSTASDLQVEGSALMTGFKRFRSLTQATYDGLTPDANTIYFIT